MNRAFLRALLARRAVIKQRWSATLQRAPTSTPLANPHLLKYLIEETLDELFGIDHASKIPKERCEHELAALIGKRSGCGLNPYLGYFLAGESALVSVIRDIRPQPRLSENDILTSETELLFAFRVQCHRDVNSFCEICRIEHPSARITSGPALLQNCPFKQAELAELKK